jgi:hypothetical protein
VERFRREHDELLEFGLRREIRSPQVFNLIGRQLAARVQLLRNLTHLRDQSRRLPAVFVAQGHGDPG